PYAARLAGKLPHAPMGAMVGGPIILVNSVAVLGTVADLPLWLDLSLLVGWISVVAQIAWRAWHRERVASTEQLVVDPASAPSAPAPSPA
ncbi:MAG: hypothetical protein WB767_14305, partial [Nocardioides sp.]